MMTKDEFFKFRDAAGLLAVDHIERAAINIGLLIKCKNCDTYNWHEESRCEDCGCTMKPYRVEVLAGNIAKDRALDNKTAKVVAAASLHVEWLKTAGGRSVEGYAEELTAAVHALVEAKNG